MEIEEGQLFLETFLDIKENWGVDFSSDENIAETLKAYFDDYAQLSPDRIKWLVAGLKIVRNAESLSEREADSLIAKYSKEVPIANRKTEKDIYARRYLVACCALRSQMPGWDAEMEKKVLADKTVDETRDAERLQERISVIKSVLQSRPLGICNAELSAYTGGVRLRVY